MSKFLRSGGVIPAITLATVLALGFSFAMIVVLLAMFAILEPWVPNGHMFLFLLLSPLYLAVDIFLFFPLSGPVGRLQNEPYLEFGSLWPYQLVFLFVFLAAAVLSLLCYRRQQKYSKDDSAAWVLFVLLFGLPGFIGYLLHRRWPVMERCQHCGAQTPRDRDILLGLRHCVWATGA